MGGNGGDEEGDEGSVRKLAGGMKLGREAGAGRRWGGIGGARCGSTLKSKLISHLSDSDRSEILLHITTEYKSSCKHLPVCPLSVCPLSPLLPPRPLLILLPPPLPQPGLIKQYCYLQLYLSNNIRNSNSL